MSARLKKHVETKEEDAAVVEQPRENVVVEFPQAEITSAPITTADEEYGDKPGQNDGYGYRVPEPDALAVDYDSIALANLERGSLLRIFRDRFRGLCKYYMSAEGAHLIFPVLERFWNDSSLIFPYCLLVFSPL